MTRLEQYTDQQARIDDAFGFGGTLCSVLCTDCDRTYFVTSPGHGDYEEGEIEDLRERAEREPDKYIEVSDFDSVSFMIHPGTGKQIVTGCICDPTRGLSEWIESHAQQLTKYLWLYWESRRKKAERENREAAHALAALTEVEKTP